MRKLTAILTLAAAMGCGSDKLDDEEVVAEIYSRFQPTIAKMIVYGLEAKDASTSGANIDDIQGEGEVAGTIVVGGKVAQSTGLNENLDLWIELHDYADEEDLVFNTDNSSDDTKLQVGIQIVAQPADNRMDGSIAGTLAVKGKLEKTNVDDAAVFALQFATDLTDDNDNMEVICSKVTGTVTTSSSELDVNFVVVEQDAIDAAQQEKCNNL